MAMNSQKMNGKTLIALEVVKQLDLLENNKLPNEYKGYISSFGASIGQAGLLPAVLFFSEKPSGDKDLTKKRREKLMNAILTLVKTYNAVKDTKDWQKAVESKVKDNKETGNYKLLDYVKPQSNSAACANEVLEAGIALKLAMRDFAASN